MKFEDKYFKKNLLNMDRFPKNIYHNSIKKAIKLVVSIKKDDSPLDILEIGIGSGNKIPIFNGCNIYGIDNDYRCINYCKKNFKGEFKLCDIEKDDIPFNKKFDMVLMIDVIEHLHYQDKTLKKIKSILNENGIFLLSTPNRSNLFYTIYKLIPNSITHSYIDKVHIKELNKKEFKNLLLDHFSMIKIKKICFGMNLFANVQYNK